MKPRKAAITAVLAASVCSALAQPAAKQPEYEVATVKLNPGCNPGVGSTSNSPDRLDIKCKPLRFYVELAYARWDGDRPRLPRVQVLGGPRWADTNFYDITARADRATPYRVRTTVMLQALLEDRFKLRVHTEAQEKSVYLLEPGDRGIRLKPLPDGVCTPYDFDAPPAHSAPAPTPAENQKRLQALIEGKGGPCGSGMFKFEGANTIADWHGVSIPEFTVNLSGRVGRTVIDKAGLVGLFDIHLEFFESRPGPAAKDAALLPQDRPAISQAVEGLGLKLTPARVPLEVIVIDLAEPPSEN